MAPKDTGYIELARQRAEEKKTHVSFPQLKYPSLRDQALKHPVIWLQGKALDDGAEDLWRVYDGIYDFTDFVDKHPGGDEWFELTKGTDITEAFECHHNNPIVYKMLEKYYLRDAKTPRNSPFTFKEDGFYKTLKREIREELKNVPKHVTMYANMIIDGLFLTLLVTSALACYATDFWVVNTCYFIASLSMAWTIVASHNYIHRRSNWRMYLFNLGLWSYRDFRVSHALSHHLYPNTLMDLEISAFEPLIYWNPRKKPVYAYLSFLIQSVYFPFAFIFNFLVRMYVILTKKQFFSHLRWHDAFGFIIPAWMYVITGVSLYHAVTTWLWIVCTASLIFFTIGSNAAHHHPKIFKDGDEVRNVNPDWGMHELEAVMDRKEINSSLFTVMTFFGDHSLHHLFPTLDHAILPYLYPVFLKNVKKFRAMFQLSDQLDLFLGQIQMCVKSNPSTLEERENNKYVYK